MGTKASSQQQSSAEGSSQQQSHEEGTSHQQSHEDGSLQQHSHEEVTSQQQLHEEGFSQQQSHGEGTSQQQSNEKETSQQQSHEEGFSQKQSHESETSHQQPHEEGTPQLPSHEEGFSKQKSHEEGSSQQQSHEEGTSQQLSQQQSLEEGTSQQLSQQQSLEEGTSQQLSQQQSLEEGTSQQLSQQQSLEEGTSQQQSHEERPSNINVLQYAHHELVEYLDIRPSLFRNRGRHAFWHTIEDEDPEKLMIFQSDREIKEYVLKREEKRGQHGIELLKVYLKDTKQTPLRKYLAEIERGENPDSKMLEDIKQHQLSREKNGILWYETVFQCVQYVMIEFLNTGGLSKKELKKNAYSDTHKNKNFLRKLESKGERGLEILMQYLQKNNQDVLRDYLAKIRNGDVIYPDEQMISILKEQRKARRPNDTANEDERNPLDEDEELHKRVLDAAITMIKDHLVPQGLLDEFRTNRFLQYSDIRDIEQLQNTTEKNRRIVQRVREKGKYGYSMFKECLTKTKHNLLRTYLEKIEKRDHTDRVELCQEMKNETDARDRKEKRNNELEYERVVKAMEEVLTKAIKKGKDKFAGKEDFKERLKIQGSNTGEYSHKIKSVFEDMLLNKEIDRICTVVKEIKVLIDVKVSKASVERNDCVVLTMPCSSSTEMRRLLRKLRGDQFKAAMSKLTQVLEETYTESIEVEAKIDTEAIRKVVGSLREQGFIDDEDCFCCDHPDVPGEFYCSDHAVFCCDKCAHTTHRTCSDVRHCTANPAKEIEKDPSDLSSKSPKEYRVMADEPTLCSTFASYILPNGQILLIDNVNNRLKKLDIFYKVNSYCGLDDPPCDVCAFEAGKILVSFGSSVQFVDVNENPTLEKKLRLQSLCFRLAWCKNHLYYTDNRSLYKCDAEGKHQDLLHTFDAGKFTCKRLVVSTDGKKIYIAAGEKGLFVLDIENKNTPVLVNRDFGDCTDICVVNNDSILVCDFKTQAICLVESQNGTLMRTVADKSHGLHNPWSLSFDKADSTLIVGMLGRDFISVLQV